MKHLHKSSGLCFECGELIDIREDGRNVRKTYDMTVITLWQDVENELTPPIVIGYYFGDYDAKTTDYYIDRWFEKQSTGNMWRKFVTDCASIVDAYYITNEDVLDEHTKRKVQTVRTGLNNLMEAYSNENI